MEYECEIVPANKILTGFNKVVNPLCSSCTNTGCTNPIVEKKVSVFGQVKTSRLYDMGTMSYYVVRCDGYFKERDDLDK